MAHDPATRALGGIRRFAVAIYAVQQIESISETGCALSTAASRELAEARHARSIAKCARYDAIQRQGGIVEIWRRSATRSKWPVDSLLIDSIIVAGSLATRLTVASAVDGCGALHERTP